MTSAQAKATRTIVETRRYERTVPDLQLDVLPGKLRAEALHVVVTKTIGGPSGGTSVWLNTNRYRKDGQLSAAQPRRFLIHELADARSRLRMWTPHIFETTFTDETNERLVALHAQVLDELAGLDWEAI